MVTASGVAAAEAPADRSHKQSGTPSASRFVFLTIIPALRAACATAS